MRLELLLLLDGCTSWQVEGGYRLSICSLYLNLAIGEACSHDNHLELILAQRRLLASTPDDVCGVDITILVLVACMLLDTLHSESDVILCDIVDVVHCEVDQDLLSTVDVVVIEE